MSDTVLVHTAERHSEYPPAPESLPLHYFGTSELEYMHRELQQWGGDHYTRYHRYVVCHRGIQGTETFYTMNTSYAGQVSVEMVDLKKREDGSFERASINE